MPDSGGSRVFFIGREGAPGRSNQMAVGGNDQRKVAPLGLLLQGVRLLLKPADGDLGVLRWEKVS